MPSERPLLMSGPLVVKTLADLKRQTRRLVKFPPAPNHLGQWEPTTTGGAEGGKLLVGGKLVSDPNPAQVAMWHTRTGAHVWCPYGQPGDRLWVRETFYCDHFRSLDAGAKPKDAAELAEWREMLDYRADHDCTTWEAGCPCSEGEWRPSIHMPRWASRLTLEVESVRVERLQDISEEDARAEGCEPASTGQRVYPGTDAAFVQTYRAGFEQLWTEINGDRPGASWSANPFVWCLSFRRIEVAS